MRAVAERLILVYIASSIPLQYMDFIMNDASALESLLSSLVSEKRFKLDNRTIQSNLEFVQQYAQHIPFVNWQGVEKKIYTWADILFMNGYTPQKLAGVYQNPAVAEGVLCPQQALLLAFFKMLETPRALLNYLPYAHRELYYRQLLGLSERGAEPAKVALAFQLAADTTELMIPVHTVFYAGQDRQGTPIQYALDHELLANQSEWTDLRWCWRPQASGLAKSFIAYDKAQEQPWPETGLRLFSRSPEDQNILTGRLLASSLLEVPEGEASIIQVRLANSIDSRHVTLYQISSGDRWLPLQYDTLPGSTDLLTFTLAEDAGLVAAPLDLEGLTLGVPALKLGRDDQQSLPSILTLQVNAHAPESGFQQFELTPFGCSVHSQPVDVPQLYLGFSGLQPGQTLSLFWQLQGATPLPIVWEYLNTDNQWAMLDATVIDTTQGLFRSGLWSAILPADACRAALSMPAGRYWLKALINGASIETEASDFPVVVGLLTNSMTASLLDPAALDALTLSQPLPADTISQPTIAIAELTSIQQPWPSWGGGAQESTEAFFQRAAQRLSHRNRALTWQNMIEMLKTQFKVIFEVAIPDSVKQTSVPAQVVQQLIVIPHNAEKDNADPLRPMLNQATLDEMADYLRKLASPWQNIVVTNPTYRDVSIEYVVSFHRGVNLDYGYRQLRLALERHYMPWIGVQSVGVVLASKLDYYEVMMQIQQHPLVDHVIKLTLDDKTTSIYGEDNEALILTWSTSPIVSIEKWREYDE
jgi:hypothetical protein